MKAMVIGANGQDGTFLVQHLLRRHYEVIAIGRQPKFRQGVCLSGFSYYQVDLEVQGALSTLLFELQPDIIFHVAAVHMSSGGVYEPHYASMMKVNVVSVHEVLEYMRLYKYVRFCYASSAKVFGSSLPANIDEKTPIKSECLYAISKNTAFHLIEYYRRLHDTRASVFYLFNHESEFRPLNFFIPKILTILAQSLRDRNFSASVHTLDFYCDWGSAEEYMDIMIDAIEKAPGEDFVVGRGECSYARQFVQELFFSYGMNYAEHIKPMTSDMVPTKPYMVNTNKLQSLIGRVPEIGIISLCENMIKSHIRN